MQGAFYPWNAMRLHPVWPERNHAVSTGLGIGIVRASCVFPHQNQLNRTCGINATESPTRALKIAPQRYFAFAFNIVSLSLDQMELRSIWLKKPKKRHQSTLCGRTQYSDSISKRRLPPIRWELSYVGIGEWHNRKSCATYRNVVTSPAVDRSAGI